MHINNSNIDSVKIQMQTWKSKIYQAVPGCKTLHPVEGLQSIEVFKIYPYLKPDSSIMDSNGSIILSQIKLL